MRILYSHRTKAADGQRVHIDGLTKALLNLGHDVLLCGPEGLTRPDESPSLDAGKGRSVMKYVPGPIYEFMEWGYGIAARQRLMAAANEFQPDIIYERYNLYYHAASSVAQKMRIPLMLEVNAPLVEERLKTDALAFPAQARRSERHIWQSADAVLPVTRVLADIIQECGVPEDRLHVMPNGVEEFILHPADGSAIRSRYNLENMTVLGFTGFVRDWHGVDRVIDWLATPDGQDTHLLLVGDGPAVPALRTQAEMKGVAGRFTVTGVVQRQAIPAHVASFDIALQPAVTAYASPLKLQEYMAQGRAILAPDQPNIREVVTPENHALLFPPDDTAIFQQQLARLSKDAGLRERLGAAAREALISRDLTWTGNARRVVKIAERLRLAKTQMS